MRDTFFHVFADFPEWLGLFVVGLLKRFLVQSRS